MYIIDCVNMYNDPFLQVDYGFLSACIHIPDGDCSSLCIVQQLQPMDSFGFQLTNELDCPLFQQTNLFRCIPPQCIRTSVSFCHECTASCKFVLKSTTASCEREPIQLQKLVFEHDSSSDMYCLNMYSISQSY